MYPYDLDPSRYGQPAPQSPMVQPQQMQSMPSVSPATFYGQTHRALSDAFQQSLQKQIDIPGLLSQMIANPQMAARIGGFLPQGLLSPQVQTPTPWQYTPPPVTPQAIYNNYYADPNQGRGAQYFLNDATPGGNAGGGDGTNGNSSGNTGGDNGGPGSE